MPPKPPPVFAVPIRKVDEAAARAVEERAEARGHAVAGQPIEPPAASKSSKLRRAESGVRVAGYLPAELETALRMHCARERRSTSDALTEAVAMLLERYGDTALQ